MAYHSKDGQSPGSYSPSDEHYHYQYYHNYSTYPTPDHASYPPQAPPPLPGSAVPPVVHHHGGGSHGSDSPGGHSVDKVNGKSESKSDDEGEAKTTGGGYATATPTMAMANPQYYYYSNGYDPYVQVLPAKADGGSESKSDDEGASGKAPGDYASPAVTATAAAHPHYHYYGSVLASGNRGLYYAPPPPLPPAPAPASTVSPGDLARESAAAVYRDSPYYSEAPHLGTGSGSSESSAASSAASSTAATATASGRPVPAKSAFMCFSESKGKASVEAVASEWKRLSKRERARWEGAAKKDKARFAEEREAYTGPLSRKLRTKKNPRAPKRPMSAFLMYAQVKRRVLQRENPDMPNADISRLLGEVWRNTSMAEKRPFLEREEAERKIYKAKMEAFKSNEKLAKSMQKVSKAKAAFGSKKTASDHRCGHHTECHPASVSSPYEYKYNDFNWASTYGHQASPNPIKYTYPRPESK